LLSRNLKSRKKQYRASPTSLKLRRPLRVQALSPRTPYQKLRATVSRLNLRAATEQGANVEAEEAAAKAAGINYAHIPFVTATPDPAAVDRFLETMVRPGYQPAFIHCAGGGRAAMMWFIKRVMVDKWDNERAMAEASQLGLTSEPLKTFAASYIQTHKR
jgi:uncharacterized protein (TIGR01244 family)